MNGELYNLITKDVAMLCRDVAMFLQIDYKRCGYVKQRCGSVRTKDVAMVGRTWLHVKLLS